MKLKEGFVTREMGGEQIMVATGETKFSGIVRSNETAAFIVNCLKEETTREQIITALKKEYEGSEEAICAGVDMILTKLRSIGAIDE